MSIYFINGAKVDLSNCELLYSDGRFSSRGVEFYRTPKEGILIRLDWTNWQGEHDEVTIIEPEEFKELMVNSPHPERAVKALKMVGLFDEIPKIE